MTSAVAKRTDHRASRSASWSAMHSDEELARILQMQEEKDYQDHLAAKELQCQNDHRLARFLSERDDRSEGSMDTDEFRGTENRTTKSATDGSSSVVAGPAVGANVQNATVISVSDSDVDFSDCFEDTTFDELAGVLERSRKEAERLVQQQDAADAFTRDEEIAEALQNDEQLNGMLGNEGESSNGEYGDASSDPFVDDGPSSAVDHVSVSSSPGTSGQGREPTVSIDVSSGANWTNKVESAPSPGMSSANNSLSVNIAWNVVGSAVNWVSGLFSAVQPPPQSNFGSGATSTGHDAEEDADEEEDDDDEEEEEGWDDDEDSEQFDDDFDDDDEMDTDMDETDDDDDADDAEVSIDFGDDLVGSGLVQEEIDVLPTRTFQSRLQQPMMTTAAAAGDTGASANEHQCQNPECQVCLSGFVDGEVLRTLPCCHQFHSSCIDVWIQRNAICPVCRVRIRDEIGY